MVQTEPKKPNFLSVTLDTVIISGLGLLLQHSLWTLAKTVKKSKMSVRLSSQAPSEEHSRFKEYATPRKYEL